MCFPFYKDLSGIISCKKPDKYLRSWYLSLIYAVHAPTEIINQSCEHLRFTFTKKNFTIIILYYILSFSYRLPPPPKKRKFFVWHHLSLVVVIKEVIDCKLSNWNKSQFGALLPVPSCSIDCMGERRASRLETNSVHVHVPRHCH